MPRPADWPPDAIATGYWLRDDRSDAEPLNPAILVASAAGTPTIYIGFGSSVGPDSAYLTAVVSNAVQQAGLRAVIASGWGALHGVPSNSNTMVIESAPHRSLFPHVAAVVHHGGAGTTAAGLLAAHPTIICPFQGDQHFWGLRLTGPGQVASRCPPKESPPSDLASATPEARDDGDMRTRASELSMGIAGRTVRASEQIESTLT